MEDIIDIIVTETTNTIEITSQSTDEVIDVNIIDNREDITLNVTPTVVEININSLTGNFGVNWGEITGTLSNQTDLNTALGLKADLVGGKVPSSQLPSYVDDVVEVANYAALPATGETGKIYITLDTNYIYRWTGSTYVEIKDSSAVWGAITGTLSSQTDLQSALNAKEPTITAGTTAQYWRGDKSWQTLNTTAVTEGTNLYYTDARARAAVSAGTGISYSSSTGVIASTITQYTDALARAAISLTTSGSSGSSTYSSTTGVLNVPTYTLSGLGGQTQLNGTGFVKASGTTISYDNTSYLPTTGGTIGGQLNISNTGAATALYIDQTNGSYHAASFNNSGGGSALYIGGTATFVGTINCTSSITGSSIVKSGGTSSQFLKADGSVDSSTYLTTSSASSTYLVKTGGTLTGALSGTSATFSGQVNAASKYTWGSATNGTTGQIATDGTNNYFDYIGNLVFRGAAASNTLVTFTSSGAATFSSSVTAGTDIRTDGGTIQVGAGAGTYYTRLATVYNYPYVDSYLDSMAGASYDGRLTFRIQRNGGTVSPVMTILPTGNVGIGTTSPSNKFHVSDGSNSTTAIFENPSAATQYIGLKSTAGTLYIGNVSNNMYFETNNAERMRITSAGETLIGRTSSFGSSYRLQVQGSADTGIYIGSSASAYTSVLYMNSAGAGAASIFTNNILYVTANTNGVYLATNGIAWIANSDERLKTDLTPIGNAINKVSSLRSVIGRYKTDEAGTKRSFLIAQDVLEVLPEAVTTNPKTGNLGVAYSDVIPLLVAAIKELKNELDALKA